MKGFREAMICILFLKILSRIDLKAPTRYNPANSARWGRDDNPPCRAAKAGLTKRIRSKVTGTYPGGTMSAVSKILQGFLIGLLISAATAIGAEEPTAVYRGSSRAVKFDVLPSLRLLEPLPVTKPARNIVERDPGARGPLGPQSIDPVVQDWAPSSRMPTPSINFDGPPNVAGYAPPDPVGDVGPDHYVAMSNVHFSIYDKTGTLVYGPAANNTLWTDFGGDCESDNDGDPVVLYDQLAERWILTQFTASGPNFYNCVAISQTSDPTGAYYRYAFSTGSNFPDYPKYGVWPDAYYISTREFEGLTGPFIGVGAYAINRAEMIAGDPSPQVISFLATPASAGGAYNLGDGLLPSDLDGFTPPPAGRPNFFLGAMDDGGLYSAPADALTLWKFEVDFATPGNSSFSLADTIPIAPYDTQFQTCELDRQCIPQPGTENKVDILSYRQRPMHRLAYRNFGSHESLVTNQSVEAASGIAGMRWWEIRDPDGTPVIYQEGTYAPGVSDGIHRWMGSIAMDDAGNMALGYSASDATNTFPSVWFAGRLAVDSLGTLPQGEGSLIDGTGSQTGSQRWGDYTSMNVDPEDDCTFWYINQYLTTTSPKGWQLRIGAFKFDQCGTPDFYLVALPNPQAICTGEDAGYGINVGSISYYDEPVTLAVTSKPPGTTAQFTQNFVTPPGSSNLIVGNTGGLTVGDYVVTVDGTASGNPGHSIDIGLRVFDLAPGPATLTAPADGATDQPVRPTFEWTTATQGASYTLEVDDDPSFASPELVETDITETSFTPGTDLPHNTVFFWRISAENPCGVGPASAVFTVTTVALPGDCGVGTIPTLHLDEGFESGAAGWSHEGDGDTWALSTARVHGGAFAYFAAGSTAISDQQLTSPDVVLPTDTPVTLQFWNWQEIEAHIDGCYDGAILEISTNGGADWTQLQTSVMLNDPYDGPVSTCCASPIADQDAWCGDPQDWLRSVVDLDAYAGQTARFRFRLATDNVTGHEGWYLDDMVVQSCVGGDGPFFADGFETGDTLEWTTTVP